MVIQLNMVEIAWYFGTANGMIVYAVNNIIISASKIIRQLQFLGRIYQLG